MIYDSETEQKKIDAFSAAKAQENYKKSKTRGALATLFGALSIVAVTRCTNISPPNNEIQRVGNIAVPVTRENSSTLAEKLGYGSGGLIGGLLALGFGAASYRRHKRGNQHRDQHFSYYPETARKADDLNAPSADRN